MKIRTRIVGFLDRRSVALQASGRALEQARADASLEQRWRDRVAANKTELAALTRRADDLARADWELFARRPRRVGQRPLRMELVQASAFFRRQAE